MATQLSVAVNLIVYRWFNDGDTIWTEVCQSFADWLWQNISGIDAVIDDMNQYMFAGSPTIDDRTLQKMHEGGLEKILDIAADRDLLGVLDSRPAEGSVYDCQGIVLEAMEESSEDEDDYLW